MEKVCAARASKAHPNVWSKDELVARAVAERGMTTTKARELPKAELCRLFGVPIVGGCGGALAVQGGPKVCSARHKKGPRYTRAELETAALALGKTKKEIRALGYDALCAFLKYPTHAAAVAPVAPPRTPKTGNCIERSSKELKAHQEAVARYMDTHRGLIVFHKVGSGKTLTAITVSQCYLDRNPTHRVVVIAPAGLIHNFRDEMRNSYANLNHPNRYEFYSYQKFTSLVKKHQKPVCRNALVIIDEGHNLRTPFKVSKKDPNKGKGINTKNVLDCTEKANKVLILTGTPIYNSRNDIFTLFNMIRDKGTPAIPLVAYRNDDIGNAEFRRLRCKVSYHDTSSDPNFPRRIDRDHTVVMTPEYKAKYLQVLERVKNMDLPDAFVTNIFGEKNLAVFFNAVRRAVNNLDNTAANRKLTWLVNTLMTSLPANEKAIVFSNFLDAGLRLVAAELPRGFSYAIIEGKVPMDVRKKIVSDFNEGKYRVLFISKAGGEGLDMKGVRHVILMDPTWNEASNEQVIGRAIRYRSHAHLPADQRNVTVHRLIHVLPEDVPMVRQAQRYFKGEQPEEPRLDPLKNSIDLFLSVFLRKKQMVLDRYNRALQSYSIEQNACP